jgi:nitrite reductase/ring-hydroxylating ferredoxin subunit
MQKIANLDDIKPGTSMYFEHQGKKALLVRTSNDEVFAYLATCPHEGGGIEWDNAINKLLCECHLSLFNPGDGSVYRHSSLFDLSQGLTKIGIQVDQNRDIHAL